MRVTCQRGVWASVAGEPHIANGVALAAGAQHIPFSADDALDAVAWDRPQLAPDFVSPRQAFHGQPSPRDTTTGVPPLRTSGQDAPVTGTGSLGVLPWVTLEARNTSQAKAGAGVTPVDTACRSMPSCSEAFAFGAVIHACWCGGQQW